MKGYLLFKDGRRQEMDPKDVGCIRFHRPHRGPDGRCYETVFVAQADVMDDCIIYEEAETVDVTARMEQAAINNHNRTMTVFWRGLKADEN